MAQTKNIYRFGNEFWVEGATRAAATVEIHGVYDGDRDLMGMEFHVNFPTRGSEPVEFVKPRAQAILAACEYAETCPALFKQVKDPHEIREHWREEFRQEGAALTDQWWEAYKAERIAARKGKAE